MKKRIRSKTTARLSPLVVMMVAACSSGENVKLTDGDGGAVPIAEAGRDRPPLLHAAPTTKNIRADSNGSIGDCLLTADCAAGKYCDLGECIQSCGASVPCGTGFDCSERGRCLPQGAEDADPPVTSTKVGSIHALPSVTSLTERDERLRITLTTDAQEPVRYRVELAAPHLSIRDARGTFLGTTTLDLPVDSKHLVGSEGSGTVKIITTLGTVIVNAPIRVGVSGTYQGTMSYDGGALPLGTVGLALALSETNGAVLAEVDAERSLLFPSAGDEPATGSGTFRYSDGVRFSLSSVTPKELGGARNHFRRPIGRTVSFQVKPDDRGNLSGTFQERIEGLMPRPVILRGSVSLERRALVQVAAFHKPKAVNTKMVDPSSPLDVGSVFPGWKDSDCADLQDVGPEGCDLHSSESLPAECATALANTTFWIDVNNYGPLLERFKPSSVEPIEHIAADCARELDVAPDQVTGDMRCAVLPRLACALSDLAASNARGQNVADSFSSLFAHTLDPAILVAENEVVNSVRESFNSGAAGQTDGLERARTVLDAPATWVLQSPILDYLAKVPAASFKGAANPPLRETALRKLGRLFFVSSSIDGELFRLSATRMESTAETREAAQTRGVLALFEAAAFIGVLDGWGTDAPLDVGTEFTDVLTPADSGFRSLVDGALVFGVPEGFVPIAEKKGDPRANYEQVFAMIQKQLEQAAADERAFTEANRSFEQNEDGLKKELLAVQTNYESGISTICGPAFEVTADPAWATCGQDLTGDAGALLVSIRAAQARLEASQGRIYSMKKKIDIERARMADVKEVRDGTVRLITSTGDRLADVDLEEATLNAAIKALDIASNANVFNGGAPLGEAAVAGVLELQKGVIQAGRQRLQSAQEARVAQDSANVEVISAMAGIQNMLVDLTQLGLEMQQDVVGVLEAQVNLTNAANRAKRLFTDRAKTLAYVGDSPLHDPSFRILQESAALAALSSRAEAQKGLYLATRALEYELNQPFGDAGTRAIWNAYNTAQRTHLMTCLGEIYDNSTLTRGRAQDYTTEFSVRKALGIDGPRQDTVTGQTMTEGDQFRRLLLQNENLDGQGGAGISFASSLVAGNELWPSNVCDDKIATIEAQLVGDFLGDNDAQLELSVTEGGVVRRCDRPELVNWSTRGKAVIQAGVNSYGIGASNASLVGRSVASSRFQIVIPGGDVAPANADVDLRKVEDIVLRVHHTALPTGAVSTPVSLECLDKVR